MRFFSRSLRSSLFLSPRTFVSQMDVLLVILKNIYDRVYRHIAINTLTDSNMLDAYDRIHNLIGFVPRSSEQALFILIFNIVYCCA